jgi:hypothetical protein
MILNFRTDSGRSNSHENAKNPENFAEIPILYGLFLSWLHNIASISGGELSVRSNE